MIYLLNNLAEHSGSVQWIFEAAQLQTMPCASVQELREKTRSSHTGCILIDGQQQAISALEAFQKECPSGPPLPVVVIIDGNDVAAAVTSVRLGAFDCVDIAADPDSLLTAVQAARAESLARLEREKRAAEEKQSARLNRAARDVAAHRAKVAASSPAATPDRPVRPQAAPSWLYPRNQHSERRRRLLAELVHHLPPVAHGDGGMAHGAAYAAA